MQPSEGLVERLRQWGNLLSAYDHLEKVEAVFDQGNRHKSGKKPLDYLTSWLSMLRPFAYATRDDSWGEMEKLLCIVMRNYVEVRRDAVKAAAEIERLQARVAELEAGVRKVTTHIEHYEGQETFTIAKWQLDALDALLNVKGDA